MKGVWRTEVGRGDRSEGKRIKKETRKICRGQGVKRLLNYANKIGLFFFSFSESSGKSWKIFNQEIF